MPLVAVRNATVWYESHGSGPAVVLCHGAGGNAASWYQQIPVLVEHGMRVIAIDHRGFGRSPCLPEHFDPTRFPEDLIAILDDAGIQTAALVCQSMGGWTGLPLALRHPERVRALVLCGTPAGLVTPEVVQAVAQAARRISESGGVAGRALGKSFQEKHPVGAFLYRQIASFNPGLPPDALGRLQRVRLAPEDLEKHAIPTLMIVGEEDQLFPAAALRSVAAAIPGARLVELAGVGHSAYFEAPERFNQILLDFLAESAGAAR